MSHARALSVFLTPPLLAVLLLAGCAADGRQAVPAEPKVAPVPQTPRDVFLSRCSRCHEASRAYAVVGQKDRWIKTAAAMAARDLRWIDTPRLKVLAAYPDEHPRVVGELFSRRCGGCHQAAGLRKLGKTPSQWKTMISFMAGRSGQALSKDEYEMLFWDLCRAEGR